MSEKLWLVAPVRPPFARPAVRKLAAPHSNLISSALDPARIFLEDESHSAWITAPHRLADSGRVVGRFPGYDSDRIGAGGSGGSGSGRSGHSRTTGPV